MPIGPVLAGMPVPMWFLTEVTRQRVEAISFFAVVILLAGLGVRVLWNRVGVEAFGWPQIGYRRALAIVALWGFAALLVLTMISGARELLTPGAWRPDGATYALAEAEKQAAAEAAEVALQSARSARVEELWEHLRGTRTAAGFPVRRAQGIDWSVPNRPGVEYVYRGGDVRGDGEVLLIEPRVFGDDQLVLHADGRIARMSPEELRAALLWIGPVDSPEKPDPNPDPEAMP